MKTFDQIAGKIVKEQEQLIGPVAWQEARKVQNLRIVDQNTGTITIEGMGDAKTVIDSLVNQYENLFGRAAREVCKEAVISLIADLRPEEVPTSLR